MAERWFERAADFVLGVVSPKRAAIRRHWRRVERDPDYRAAYELALRLRGYKSAASGKNQTPWLNASNRSADGEIIDSLPTLRNRSRAANRDDALALGITETLKRGVIGTGLRPQSRTGDDRKDEALEAVWKERCDKLALSDGGMAHGAHQALVYGKRNEDGDIFLKPAVARPGEPMWIETVEAERVCTPLDATPEDTAGRIVDGVEKDQWGRVVAYWICKYHPGDTIIANTKIGPSADVRSPYTVASFWRVPEPFVRHERCGASRPGQTRGVPKCHPILQELRDLDLLILASLKRNQIAACLSVFLTSDQDSADLIELTAEDYGYQLDQKLEPGMIFRLYPGEKAEFLTPNTGVVDLDKLIWIICRRIAAATGLSPQAILRAWEGINYSGARTIKGDDRLTFKKERSDFAPTLTWEWRLVQQDALLRGDPRLIEARVAIEDIELVEWIGDEEQWVDPQAEAAAIQIMLQLKLTTYQIECAKLGRDWQENLRQAAAAEAYDRDLRAQYGLAAASASPTPANLSLVPKEEPAAEELAA
jgi:lambda family phage portal protein